MNNTNFKYLKPRNQEDIQYELNNHPKDIQFIKSVKGGYLKGVVDNINYVKKHILFLLDEYTILNLSLHNNDEILKILIDNGIDVHIKNDMLLKISCYEGNIETVRMLLNYKFSNKVIETCKKVSIKNNHKDVLILLTLYTLNKKRFFKVI